MAVRADSTEAYRDSVLVAARPRAGVARLAVPRPGRDGARLRHPDPDLPRHPGPRRLPLLHRHLPVAPEQDGRRPGTVRRLPELRRSVPGRPVPPDGVQQRRLHRRRRRPEVRAGADDGPGPRPGAALQQLLPDAALRSLGDTHRHRVPELAVDLRRSLRLPQQLPDHLPHHEEHHLLALRSEPRHGLCHRGRGLGGHALLHHDVPGGAPGDSQGALRGRRDRRGLDRPAVLLRHHPAASHDLPHDGDALDHLDGHEPPVRLHPDQGRSSRSHADLPLSVIRAGARGLPARQGRRRLPRPLPACSSCSSSS